ncbi:hypothetical protein [Streptomyces sp. NPDC054834]
MHTHIQLVQQHMAELRTQADAYRLAAQAKRPSELRTRLGWTLVEVGLRLAATREPAPAMA